MRDLSTQVQTNLARQVLVERTDDWLRASMTRVDASVEALWKPDLPQDARQELLDALDAQGIELERIVRKTHDLVQLDRDVSLSANHPVTLRPVIDQVARRFQATFGGSLQVSLSPDLPFVMGDEQKIELALTHLVEGVLAMQKVGESLEISTTADEEGVVVIVECSEEIDVTAEQDDQTDLLPLATYKLGLYIAEKLIRVQGGRFWTKVRPGVGTRFLFSLPEMEGMDVAKAFID
jgi:signal transduction histidine kinase